MTEAKKLKNNSRNNRSNLPEDMLKNGGPGRPKGSKNKFNKFRDALLDNFEKRASLGELEDMRLDKVADIIAKLAPKEQKIEIDKPIVIRWETDADKD